MSKSIQTKTTILSKLSHTEGKKAEELLLSEYRKLKPILQNSEKYQEIHDALELLDVFSFRVSSEAIEDLDVLINRLEKVTLGRPVNPYARPEGDFYSNASLQVKSISSVSKLRYLESDMVSEILLSRSIDSDEKVSQSALREIEQLSKIDLRVFQSIGIRPQKELLKKIVAFEDDELRDKSESIFIILEHFLSSDMETHSSDFQSITITNAALPADNEILIFRKEALELLKHVYYLGEDIRWKMRALSVFNKATSCYSRGEVSKATYAMIGNNTVDVLGFFKQLIPEERLQIVQKIESDSYWIYYHNNDEKVFSAALEIEQEIKVHEEYQIYRELVGYDGIFGDWEDIKKEEKAGRLVGEERKKNVIELAHSIDGSNFDEWRERILNFSKTESDDLATFPSMYDFLRELAARQPALTLKFLVEEDEVLTPFLISMMGGLWDTVSNTDLRSTIKEWVAEGKHLYACTKLFLSIDDLDEKIFRAIYKKAVEKKDTVILSMILSVVSEKFSEGNSHLLGEYFIPVLKNLTKLENSDWIREIWFRKERRELFSSSGDEIIEATLENLLYLKEIDYHVEEILCVIAENDPQRVLNYFGERLGHFKGRRERSIFDLIPYQFHKLHEQLSKDPKATVGIVRSWFDNTDRALFEYRGARLLGIIFPHFSTEFEAELIDLVRTGEEDNLQFVLAVLRTYDGQVFLYNVCMEIVKLLPENNKHLNEVRIVLDSTGVVSGEYGYAEAKAKKIKDLEPLLNNKDARIVKFVGEFIEDLAEGEKVERKSAEEEIELRKFQYGVNEEK